MRRLTLTALALCLLAVSALAQGASTGRLVGTVSGPDGVITGATVNITDNQTGRKRTVVANEEGAFAVPQLESGTYTVEITAAGFKTFTVNEVKIDVGREYSLNPTLEVGQISESVVVTAGADILNATSAELSNTVSPRQIQDLPLDGRDPLDLVQLQPGVANNGATNTSINGQRPSATNITRDGINVQDQFIRESASDFSPQRSTTDNIGEFTVTTSNGGADLGYGASHVQQVTQRGSSEFHGAAFAYNRNSYFAANEFFNNASGVVRPRLNRNQFGGKLAGPVPVPNFGEGGPTLLRDKGFFFFAYEELRQPIGSSRGPRTILLPQARQGIFTYVDNAGVTRQINLFDPRFGTGLTGVNPLIQSRILDRLPTTGNAVAGDNLNTTGFRFNQAADSKRRQFDTRFDLDANERHSFNGVFVWVRDQNFRPTTDGTQGFGAIPVTSDVSPNETLVLAWRATPNSRFTNEVRGGYFSNRFAIARNEEAPAFFLTLPLISNPEVSFLSQGRETMQYNLQDNANYTRGDHALKFGGLLQIVRTDTRGSSPDNSVPLFSIGSLFTQITAAQFADPTLFPGGINATQRGRANSLLALLGGLISSGTQEFNATREGGFERGAQKRQRLAYENIAFYVQDSWRATPNLTLNAGVRYEIYTPVRDEAGALLEVAIPPGGNARDALLDPNGSVRFAGENTGGGNTLFNYDLNNFGPNFSLAYTPQFKNRLLGALFPGGGRTVLRGGYNISYFNDEYVKGALTAAETTPGLRQTVSFPTLNVTVNNVPTFPTPTLQIPRTFAQQRAQAGPNNFLFGLNSDLQVAASHQWNVGIQRELGWQTALELRYVGGRSNNLTNIIDINQVDIINNGFLQDFIRAKSNLDLARALNAQQAAAGVPAAQRVRITGSFNPAVPGSQQLPVFSQLGTLPGVSNERGALDIAGIQNRLDRGVPAELALVYFANPPLQGNVPVNANPNAVQIGYLDNQARYNHHAAQVELRRRFSQGLYFQANYTFSKTLTDASGLSQLRFEPQLDINRPELEYTRADYDQTHRFNVNSIYELPFGRGKRFFSDAGGFVDRLIGGFRFNSIVELGSGAPITIIDNRSTFSLSSGRMTPNSLLNGDQIKDLIGIFRTPCGVYFINPAVINLNQAALSAGNCSQVVSGSFTGRAANGFYEPTFAGQAFLNVAPGQIGNVPRAIANGPVYFNVNAALVKDIRVKESLRVSLRAEAFNLFNRTNFFAGITEDINSTTFGRVEDTFSPRIMQFALRVEF